MPREANNTKETEGTSREPTTSVGTRWHVITYTPAAFLLGQPKDIGPVKPSILCKCLTVPVTYFAGVRERERDTDRKHPLLHPPEGWNKNSWGPWLATRRNWRRCMHFGTLARRRPLDKIASEKRRQQSCSKLIREPVQWVSGHESDSEAGWGTRSLLVGLWSFIMAARLKEAPRDDHHNSHPYSLRLMPRCSRAFTSRTRRKM